ncbi:MAG: hypothetical protein ACKOKG_08035, partial [Verrucomicrobiota bacterium]
MTSVRLILVVCLLVLLPGSSLAQSGPRIVAVDPPAGRVETLDRVSVTFSVPVNGVRAVDFLVNGVPATSVSSSGTTHHFFFKQPPFGAATITWGPLHTIQDLAQPPVRFDASVAGANWNYELIDLRPPELNSVLPVPGVTLKRLSEVQVVFHRPVSGVDAADLRINGAPALDV